MTFFIIAIENGNRIDARTADGIDMARNTVRYMSARYRNAEIKIFGIYDGGMAEVKID